MYIYKADKRRTKMAYINKESTKAIREELKRTFPNTKFSVKKTAGSLGVLITVVKQDTDDVDFAGIIEDFDISNSIREGGVYRFNTDRASEYKNFLFDTLKKVAPYRIYNRVDLGNNDYDIYFTEQQREFFNKVLEISKVAPVSAGVIDKWEDNSDIMTDYFDVTYYTTVRFECGDFFKD